MAFALVNHPVLCNYYLTYRCNASCSFCDIWEKPSSYVTLQNVESNLQELKKMGVRVVDFTGGEPLLHRQLGSFLTIAKSLGLITTVTTNGLLYPKRAEELKGKVDMLHFSLDFFDQHQHNASRNVSCFQSVMDSVDLALELGEKPDILYTVTKQSLSQIHKAHQYCVTKGLVLILNPIFNYAGIAEQNDLNHQELKELKKWGSQKNVFLNQAFLELRKDGGNQITHPVCKAGTNTVVISPENELITPCYHLGLSKFQIKGDLSKLWHSLEVKQERSKAGIDPKCQGCTINCYMQPSFATHLSKYFFKALPSTIKYNRLKGTWKQLF